MSVLREIFTRLTVQADPAAVKQMTEALKSAKDAAGAAAMKIAAIGASAGVAVAGLAKLGREGAEAKQIALAYEELGGTLAELEQFRGVTQNLVSDTDIQKAMNMGRLFKLPAEQIPALMKIAQGSAVALGTSVSKNLDDVFTAMARGSVMIADNLGTQMGKVEDINEAYAKQHGLNAKTMTDEQKKLAFVEAFVAKSSRQLALADKAAENTFALMDAAKANLRGIIADIAFTVANSFLKDALPKVRAVTAALSEWWMPADATKRAEDLAEELGISIEEAGDRIVEAGNKANRRAQILIGTVKLLASALSAMVAVQAARFFRQLIVMTIAWTKALWASVSALSAFQIALVAIPAALLLIGLLIEDIIVWSEGGDSAIGAFIDRFYESEGILGSVARWLRDNTFAIIGFAQAVVKGAGQVWAAVKSVAGVVFDALQQVVSRVMGALSGARGPIMGALASYWEAAKANAAQVWSALQAALDALIEVILAIVNSGLIQSLLSLGRQLVASVVAIIKALLPIVVTIIQAVIKVVQALMPAIIRLVQAIVGVVQKLIPLGESIVGKLVAGLDFIMPYVLDIVDAIVDGIDIAVNDVLPVIIWVIEQILKYATILIEWVLKAIGWVVEGIGWLVEKAAALAAWIIDNLITPVVEFLSWAVEGVGKIFKAIFDGIMVVAQPVIDLIQWAIEKVDWAAEKLGIGGGPSQVDGAGVAAAASQFNRALATGDMSALSTTTAPRLVSMGGQPAGSTTTVGAVQVTVQGTTDMGPADLAKATQQGVSDGMTKAAGRDLDVGVR